MRSLSTIIALALCLLACKPTKSEPVEMEEAPVNEAVLYASAVERLDHFLDQGMVVSKWDDGTIEHKGDSLIWTGMALGSLPCRMGLKPALAIRRMIAVMNGGLYRHHDLVDSVSMDGALGLYWGLARRLKRCHEAEFWKDAIKQHVAFLDSHQVLKLNPNDTASLVPGFDYLPRLLAYEAGVGEEPPKSMLRSIEVMAIAWTMAVKSQKAAAFRVHLAMLALETAEELGAKLDQPKRAVFCAAAHGLEMPTVDNFCGRDGLKAWIANEFEWDAWEYRHQRAGIWEAPDGKAGLETPGVDLLVALTAAYDIL